MTYQEALTYIHKTDWKGSCLGLSRIEDLLCRLGNPHKRLRFVHVAGTNGKGSVCSMLTSILTAAGYRTGLFTSPFLLEFRERIRIGDELISEEELCEAVQAVRPHADAMQDAPTEFELMTAVAFWYFERKGVDVVVCEVGLGGELDSTNVIECPLLSVITSIALDHTEQLGSTLSEVARAKAGIFKKGSCALFGEPENAEALSVIAARADEMGIPLILCEQACLSVDALTLSGTEFSYKGWKNVRLSLCGAYQGKNAAIALEAVEVLRTRGLDLPERAVREGLLAARWIGRFEVFGTDPVVIVDGAHNPHGAGALADCLEAILGKDALVIGVVGVMADKEYPEVLGILKNRLKSVYTCAPQGHPRALQSEKLAAVCSELSIQATSCESVQDAVKRALDKAKEEKLPLLIFGSLYLYREVHASLTALL